MPLTASLRAARRIAAVAGISGLMPAAALSQVSLQLASPDGRNVVTVAVGGGALTYAIARDGVPVITPSRLGFEFRGAPALRDSLRITDTTRAEHDATWTQPWGEVARVRDHHRELRVQVSESGPPGRRFAVVFRAFDDGVGFRYELPEQPALRDFEISEELTEFTFADNAHTWWIPANRKAMDRYEFLYNNSPLSMIDSVHTPLVLETHRGLHIAIHEAALVDYATMDLARVGERTLRPWLQPWADGVKVRGRTPFVTPWRTIQLADRVAGLVPSVIGLNLNEPSRIADTHWITPMKYVGIWWGMHAGLYTWPEGPTHGATTANAKRYIDFAAANGLGGVLVEGWNQGWNGDWIGNANFSFTQPFPDYDLAGVAAYAKAKGVMLIMHNETAMGIENYERQLDSAFALYRALGIRDVKTGYVNDLTPEGHSHTGQYMVRHYRKVAEVAARYGLTVNAHEPIKDTGERRTWPNVVSREGARGGEYNAGGPDGGNIPEHESVLFFTRLLGGPMDYTPGIFDILLQRPTGRPRTADQPRVRTTLAKQLALYVVLYSPVQMAADVIENYADQPAFRFIRDVPVDWDTTRVIDGKIGDFVVVARKARGTADWYLGAISDEHARTFDVALTFLTPGRRYVAEIYADGPQADWLTNPLPVTISSRPVNAASRLRVVLAPGGGQAVRLRAVN
ncbi:MAG: glycoside hydrolase family 97 protein [Gemmatimonadaceae bacterium]|nr:glycoside hydrolase family 97 protein [Gemmatimonadaceae bacterium]